MFHKHSPRNSLYFLVPSTCTGSITIEAAFILPILLSLISSLFLFFSAMAFELKMQEELFSISEELSLYTAVSEEMLPEDLDLDIRIPTILISGVLSETKLKQTVIYRMQKEEISFSHIRNKEDGISFFGSFYDPKTADLYLNVSYTYQFPFLSSVIQGIPISHGIRRRMFVGSKPDEKKEEEETYVYITRTGEVYHLTPTCTYIHLSIHEVNASSVLLMRNQSGKKYTPCERCTFSSEMVYYVTDYGERYHSDRNCSSLLRDVSRVPLSQVKGRRPCSKCGGYDGP